MPHGVVFLAAFTAEVGSEQKYSIFLAAGCEALRVEGDLAFFIGLQGAEHFAGTADELMELEREQGTAVRGGDLLGGSEEDFQSLLGLGYFNASIFGQQLGCLRQAEWSRPTRTGLVFHVQAERQFRPDGERIAPECVQIAP